MDPGGQAVSAMDRLYLVGDMPTLIIWGSKDRIIPLSHAYQAHEAIPNSRLEIIDGVGHFPHVEEPLRFVELMLDFLQSTEPSNFSAEERRNQLFGDAERT